MNTQELIKLHGGVLEIESLTAAESNDGSREFQETFYRDFYSKRY